MCERYVLPDQSAAEREFEPAHCWWKFAASFNVASSQYVPAVRIHNGASEATMMRWGLIPVASEGVPGTDDPVCIDIPALEREPEYRPLWLNSQRCILPVAGFYSWRMTAGRFRQPYFVRLSQQPVFGFAAIWSRSESADDDVIESCAIVMAPPNTLLAEHGKWRMPAIVRREDYSAWLKGTPVRARAAVGPYPAEWMRAHAISPRVNSLKHNDAALIQPVA